MIPTVTFDTLQDQKFMAAAIRLARRNLGQTADNPSVGAIIVRSINGQNIIVGHGVTAVSGRPHAETIALAKAGELAKGANAYVTLEPCSHYGKTPPCAKALIEAGIARVVTAVDDPDTRVSGRGFDMLQAAGIKVTRHILEQQARKDLSIYLNQKTRNKPYVTLKLALSANHKIGMMQGEQVKVTGEVTKRQVHLMRAQHDAILIGANTAINDDPSLTCRVNGFEHRSPKRIILSRSKRIPETLQILKNQNAAPTFVLNHNDLADVMTDLTARGIKSVMVEGGATIAKAFLDAGLVDRICLYKSQAQLPDNAVKAPITPDTVPNGFELVTRHPFGDDLYYEYRIK